MTNSPAATLTAPVRLARRESALAALGPAVDWPLVTRLLLTSRTLDRIEEDELLPAGKLRYQFSARGHELAQILLGLSLDHPHDAATVYYRSRPFMLATGLTAEEAFCGTMARIGSPNGGRDIGQPGPRTEYIAGYYGAFVLDPDGNNIEAVWHDAQS